MRTLPFSAIVGCLLLHMISSTAALSLSEEVAGQYYIKSTHGTYMGHVILDVEPVVALLGHNKACEQWTITDHDGKVALKPYCVSKIGRGPEYLHASPDGSVSVTEGLDGSKLWTPIKNDDGSWSFISKFGGWLSADKNRSVYTVTDNIDTWEHLWLESWGSATTTTILPRSSSPNSVEDQHESEEDDYDRMLSAEIAGKHSLKSAVHFTWIRAHQPDGQWVVDMAPHSRVAERWVIEDHKGMVALRSPFCLDYYLYGKSDGSVDLAKILVPNLMWTPFKHDDGTWSLQSVHGGWLSADKNGSVYTVTENIDSWENFRLESWEDSVITTVSPSTSSAVSIVSEEENSMEDEEQALSKENTDPVTTSTRSSIDPEAASEEEKEEERDDSMLSAEVTDPTTSNSPPSSTSFSSIDPEEESGEGQEGSAIVHLPSIREYFTMSPTTTTEIQPTTMPAKTSTFTNVEPVDDSMVQIDLRPRRISEFTIYLLLAGILICFLILFAILISIFRLRKVKAMNRATKKRQLVEKRTLVDSTLEV